MLDLCVQCNLQVVKYGTRGHDTTFEVLDAESLEALHLKVLDELLTGRVKVTVPEKEKKSRKNIDKLRLVIRVLRPAQKPIKIALLLSVVKRFARLGVSISNAVGGDYISEDQLSDIMNMVDEGIRGVILDIVTDDDTNVIVEID